MTLQESTGRKETWLRNGKTYIREGSGKFFTWSEHTDRGRIYFFSMDKTFGELEAARNEVFEGLLAEGAL